MAYKLPLEGIRVVDVTVVWAGPYVTQLLAEWGAEVIRVEPLFHTQPSTRGGEIPVTKEMVRAMKGSSNSMLTAFPNDDPAPRPWNRGPSFNSHARDKLSMTCDVLVPGGLDIFRRLIAISDVYIENNVPETIEKAHITHEELVPYNEKLISLRMPSYGLSGPYKNWRSFGTHMEGMTGHHYLRSYRHLDPSMVSDAFTVDAATGVMGAVAVMMALRHRARTGRGQLIEMAQAENFLPYLGEIILDYTMNGRVWEPQANRHPNHAPHNVYPCAGDDRWIAIDCATDEEWAALCRVAGNPSWAHDERFKTSLGRLKHQDELDEAIGEWTRDKNDFELFHQLQAAGVTSGPVQNEADAFACPQLNERGFFEELTHPECGTHRYPGLMHKMSKTPNKLKRHPVMLGEDNEYVYKKLLGFSDEEYRKLEEQGQIGLDPAGREPLPVTAD
ncbi:MAG TPA: CoA transferase [Dehalococcoidia bacterium]|nr:CoA transferase [Dehalococcoidia bacterium]